MNLECKVWVGKIRAQQKIRCTNLTFLWQRVYVGLWAEKYGKARQTTAKHGKRRRRAKMNGAVTAPYNDERRRYGAVQYEWRRNSTQPLFILLYQGCRSQRQVQRRFSERQEAKNQNFDWWRHGMLPNCRLHLQSNKKVLPCVSSFFRMSLLLSSACDFTVGGNVFIILVPTLNGSVGDFIPFVWLLWAVDRISL